MEWAHKPRTRTQTHTHTYTYTTHTTHTHNTHLTDMEWAHWRHLVPAWEYPKKDEKPKFAQLVIPTLDR